MKKRSVLKKQSVKKRRQKKKTRSSVFSVINLVRQVCPAFLKCSIFLIIIACTSFSLIYCYHCLLTSPYIRLEKVEVKGVDQEIRNELITLCGLNAAPNLLALRLNDLKRKMERHPWIRTVQLKRRFPHTLIVNAEKHVPSALVVLNEVYYMNQQCEIFKQIANSDKIDFPIITGVSGRGQKAQWQLHRAAQAIMILESQKKPWSLENLSEIHVKNDGISLYFTHLPAAINVMSVDLECKMDGLKKVTRQLRKEGRIHRVTGIDLNSEDGAVVSFRKS